MKLLIEKESLKKFLVNEKEDFHTKWGKVSKEEINKTKAKSGMGKEFFSVSPSFHDLYRKIKRKAQIVSLTTLGRVAAESCLNKDSIVIDAGTGSGAACSYFSHLCKKIYTFDNNDSHIEVAKSNAKFLSLKNIKFTKSDVYEEGFKGVNGESSDFVFLDLSEPHRMLEHSYNALKRGGILAVCSPQMTQVSKLREKFDQINSSEDKFTDFKVIEIIERSWKVEKDIARPSFDSLGHNGFIAFMRKI